MKKIIFIIFGVFCVLLIGGVLVYNNQIGAVSSNENLKDFEVKSGSTYLTIAKDLKDANLIKSEIFYKIYIKLNNPKPVQTGKYKLSEAMSLKDIVKVFEQGSSYNPNAISITFPEGINMRKIAKIIAEKTNNTEKEVFDLQKNTTYLNSLKSKYWFITDDIKNSKIYYALEGYLFPDTYAFNNKDVTVEEIFTKMLDRMNTILTPLKDKIEDSDMTVHEILTLASIVQTEGNNEDDWNTIAGVFYNRIESNILFGSCVTVYYGAKRDFGTGLLLNSELEDKNPYNTYVNLGLPIGPIATVGNNVIVATLNKPETAYVYFISDKYKKTYFFTNITDRDRKMNELKNAGLWDEGND